jgi:catechol 2,3-dioxygenase-like lactoylglutathione lyase family enzyme
MTTTLSNTGPRTEGVHHVGLTIPDLVAARVFFVEALGFEQVGERPEYPAVFLSDGTTMITLWQAENADTAIPFDRRRVIGLHHLALRLADTSTLDALHSTLNQRDDVQIEFDPEPLGGGNARHMMCRIPGNIRLELIVPASA